MRNFANGVNFGLLVAIAWGVEPGTGGRIAAAIVLAIGFAAPVLVAVRRELERAQRKP
jgi:hypothetical protein